MKVPTKKLRDLTKEDIEHICEQYINSNCKDCPLQNDFICLRDNFYLDEDIPLEREVKE